MNFETNKTLANEEITRDIQELIEAVNRLPEAYQRQVKPSLEKAVDGIRRRRRILKLVQDALSQLRMDMKYLVFDLEATRRERDAYRDRLDQ
jgi:DNA-binding transcriptional regulator GbsR (MarR family)